MKLYITGAALILLAVVYLPIVIFGLVKLWRTLPARMPIRIVTMVIVALIAAAIPFWDVAITSVQMATLCPQAGVVVKRSVRVAGYFAKYASEAPIKRGFEYAEGRDLSGKVVVYRRSGGGVQKREFSPDTYQVVSRYEFIENEVYGRVLRGYLNINTDRSVVRDRATGEELGYAVRYRAYPGWVDRLTVARFGQVLWVCPPGGGAQESRLEREVLLPSNE